MKNLEHEITEELLREYVDKKCAMHKLQEDVSALSNKIKMEMELHNKKISYLHGYKIELETKYEPIDLFYEKLYKNNLSHLITKKCSPSHFKTACLKLNLSDNEIAKLMREKSTKWLHVTHN